MKVLIFALTISIGHSVNAWSLYGESLKLVKCNCNRTEDLNVDKLKFFVDDWETEAPTLVYDMSNIQNFFEKDLDTTRCLYYFFLGWDGRYKDYKPIIKFMFRNLRCKGKRPYLVLIESYAYFYLQINIVESYIRSAMYTKSIGMTVGKKVLAAGIQKFGKDSVVLTGHSFGAQMSGYAAVGATLVLGYKPKNLFAIDPAGPCFVNCPKEHVKSGNADAVYTFHSDAKEIGSNLKLADYDFYAHDGETQTECGVKMPDFVFALLESLCSHLIGIPISYEPANRGGIWNATKCDNYKDYCTGVCDKNEHTLCGVGITPTSSKGVYYFETDTTFLTYLLGSIKETVKK